MSIFDQPSAILASDQWKMTELSTNMLYDAYVKLVNETFSKLFIDDWIEELNYQLNMMLSTKTGRNWMQTPTILDNQVLICYKEPIYYALTNSIENRYLYIKFERI